MEESLAEGRKGGGEVRRGLRSPLHINTPRLGLDPRPSISISLLRTQAEATYLCPLCESSPPRPCLPAAIAPCLPATLLPCLAPAIPPSSPLPPYPQKLYTPWNGRHPRLARPLPCPPFPSLKGEKGGRGKGEGERVSGGKGRKSWPSKISPRCGGGGGRGPPVPNEINTHSLPLSLLCSSAISSSFCLALGSWAQGESFQGEGAVRLTFFSNVLCRP